MAMILHSFAQQQHTPHELLDAAAEHLGSNLEQYNSQVRILVVVSSACAPLFCSTGPAMGQPLPQYKWIPFPRKHFLHSMLTWQPFPFPSRLWQC
jgi:hypothetical protein